MDCYKKTKENHNFKRFLVDKKIKNKENVPAFYDSNTLTFLKK